MAENKKKKGRCNMPNVNVALAEENTLSDVLVDFGLRVLIGNPECSKILARYCATLQDEEMEGFMSVVCLMVVGGSRNREQFLKENPNEDLLHVASYYAERCSKILNLDKYSGEE